MDTVESCDASGKRSKREIAAWGNPYHVEKRGDKWAVIKSRTGETVPGGTHGSKGKALAHFRALEANVKDA